MSRNKTSEYSGGTSLAISPLLQDDNHDSRVVGVPPVLWISTLIHGHGHPELAKKLNDKIVKIDDQMFERVRVFIRGEAVAGIDEVIRDPQWENRNNRGGWSEGQERFQGRSNQRETRQKTSASYARKETFTPLIKTPEGNLGHGYCKLSTTSVADQNSREVEHEQVL
nr:hypothetical protein [Tanacetum cinerariifolium]